MKVGGRTAGGMAKTTRWATKDLGIGRRSRIRRIERSRAHLHSKPDPGDGVSTRAYMSEYTYNKRWRGDENRSLQAYLKWGNVARLLIEEYESTALVESNTAFRCVVLR